MRLITAFFLILALGLSACSSTNTTKGSAMPQTLAAGTNGHFLHTVVTDASKEEIWRLWTTPETWGKWDGGLKSARLDTTFEVGAKGKITDLDGRESTFTITEVDTLNSYTFKTNLPLARLTIKRFFHTANDGRTAFTHEVRFSGLLGGIFARSFGPGFRAELPPTMERLAQLATEGDTPNQSQN